MSTPPALRLDGKDRVVAALTRHGALSRAELARRTALAPSTVSALVASLVNQGLLVEREDHAPAVGARGGRPALLLSLDRSAGIAVGIDTGKRHLRVAVADLSHELLAERSRSIDASSPQEAACVCAELVGEALHDCGAQLADVVGVGVGWPAPVPISGTHDAGILPGWGSVAVAAALRAELGVAVEVDNDANLGALSEWMWGAGKNCSDVTYVKVATGIGAGLIVAGRPVRGAGGTAGELGHTVLDAAGPPCRCGSRGCLEVTAGVPAVLTAAGPAAAGLPQVLRAARQGDGRCRAALAGSGEAIGRALGTLCNLVNPQRIVVGGELSAAGELLLEPLRASLHRHAIRSAASDVEVVEGAFGDRAEVLGAVALALRLGTRRPKR